MALRLKRRGITRVRPLQGGYAAWVAAGYPLQRWESVERAEAPLALGG